MTTRRFRILMERDDTGFWVTYVPALNFLSTFGETRDAALENTSEAILGYIEAAAKEGIDIPDSDPRAEWVDLEVALP